MKWFLKFRPLVVWKFICGRKNIRWGGLFCLFLVLPLSQAGILKGGLPLESQECMNPRDADVTDAGCILRVKSFNSFPGDSNRHPLLSFVSYLL